MLKQKKKKCDPVNREALAGTKRRRRTGTGEKAAT